MRILLLLLGCQGAGGERPGRFPVGLTAQASDNDAVVATVDGRAIHASDVATQARARGLPAKAALDDLIDAEVLVGEAARRGLDRDGDAQETAESTAVRRLLASGFESEVTPATVPMSLIKKVYEKNRGQLDHDIEIDVWHILVPAKNLKPEDKPAARAAAEELAKKAHGIGDLDQFKALASGLPTAKTEHVVTEKDGWTLKEFSYPAFEQLKKAGDTSKVIETSYGWHVLYLVGYRPARHTSLEEAEPELRKGVFPEYQKPEFMRYCERLAGNHSVDVHPERLK